MKREDAALRCKTTDRTDTRLSPVAKPAAPSTARPSADIRYIESRLKQFSLR